ncbi:MAG: hypothetical protein K2K70_01535 [Lachnospiraceae bacterium]|nr:hypothetical protein [Lachnospiraceae bacterium]
MQYGLSPEEIAERIEGVCKMKNMPGQELGELGSLPQENINVLIYLANETGDMEFYMLERNPYAGGMGQLKTSFITGKCLATRFIESMVKPGQEEIQTEALFETDIPQPEEVEFIRAVERQIEDLLRQAEMQGEYEIQIGEYELFFENKACISAVVTGEQEYYVRYLIVRYGDDRYYFRPVGFGSDGSLEECEFGRHHMNQICAERTKLLNREKFRVNI